MKMIKKTVTIFVTLIAGLSVAFADETTTTLSGHDEISASMETFSESIFKSVPEAATQQNVWADAYIGKLFPSLIPHFGAGASVGGTALDMTGLKSAADGIISSYKTISEEIGQSIADSTGKYVSLPGINFGIIPDTFILPTCSADIRLGGVLLPFDIGFCAIATNPSFADKDWTNIQGIPATLMSISSPWDINALGFNGKIDYITLGADLRFRIIPEGDIIPAVSVGGGYYYIAGDIALNSSDSADIEGIGKQTTEAGLEISYSTQVVFAQVQVSKKISSYTVFAGGRGLLSSTATAWKWNFKTANDGENTDAYAYEDSDASSEEAASSTDLAEAFSSMTSGSFDWTSIQPQIYAGAAMNISIVQITASVCADVRSLFENSYDFIWSGAISCHVKL